MRFAPLISVAGLKFCLAFLQSLQLNNTINHICLISTFRHNLKEASILRRILATERSRNDGRRVAEHRAQPASIDAGVEAYLFIGNGQTGVTYCTLVRKGEVISA